MASIKHVFINFGALRGELSFDDDSQYDACVGSISLRSGESADENLFQSTFFGPVDRDDMMAVCFRLAADYMEKLAHMTKGF